MYKFPEGFRWGSSTASTQIEGAALIDGKGPSVWDMATRKFPERFNQNSTPDIACDHYHRYKEDVKLMKELGHNSYRFSISWPRIFPNGFGEVNEKGIKFYNDLIDELIKNAIEPFVCLNHWDIPLFLFDLGGWENPYTIECFVEYAKTCFKLFGDRVKKWSTHNEPAVVSMHGYLTAHHPPYISDLKRASQVSYNLVLSHAKTVEAYKNLNLGGEIGIILSLSPHYAATNSEEDIKSAHLADLLLNSPFLDPILSGEYSEELTTQLNKFNALPTMPKSEMKIIKENKVDFVGVNYYFPNRVSGKANFTDFKVNNTGNTSEADKSTFSLEGMFKFVKNPNGKYTDWEWEIYPEGLYDLLMLPIKNYGKNIPLYVTENGIGRKEILDDGTVQDEERIEFVKEHLIQVHKAIENGADVRGYYMWSTIDCWSWQNGYNKRYAFIRVEPETLKRTIKKSGYWYKQVSLSNGFE